MEKIGPLRGVLNGWRAAAMAAALLCIAIVGGLGMGLQHMVQRYQQEAEQNRWGFWQLTHAQIELHRFSAHLARAAAGDAAARAELPLRLDLLWGRINQLDGGGRWEDAPALRQLHAEQPSMQQALQALETQLNAGPPQLPSLLSVLSRLEAPLQAATQVVHERRQDRVRQHLLDIVSQLHWFSIGFLLLTAATAVLVGLLAIASNRAQAARLRAEAASAEAREANRTLRSVIDGVPALVSAFDAQGRYVFANHSVCAYSGRTEAELVGRRPTELGLPKPIEAPLRRLQATGCAGPPEELSVPHAAGGMRRLLVTVAPLHDATGVLTGMLRISMDVTAQRAAELEARHLHDHDALTGLPNRARFGRELAGILTTPETFALHLIDLDQFRLINDTHGHATGDALLIAFGRRLCGMLRPGDEVARLAADEFAVLQRHTKPGDALALAARMAQALGQPYQLGGSIVRCTASIGASERAIGQPSPEALLAQAELALREARREGSGRFSLFRPELESEASERRALQAELAAALRNGELHLAFQPKFTIPDRRMTGVEALLRWNHPERGAISPGVFVPLAEEAGLALPLARYVLQRAARQAMQWQAAGHAIPVAVNLSAELIGLGTTMPLVRETLRESGLPAHLLEIEVTESTFIGDSQAARDMLAGLRAMGIRVGLDDFGTGFSSLAYLQDMPVDVIKIDRSFVNGMDLGGATPRIVETVVRLAHGLGASVVAEGVETEAQFTALAALGCDMAQGFLLARPVPPEQILAFAGAERPVSAA
ncbi:MAG: EAL domain-containing protein [Alphaproteobacteria bacterium]|nr:EAL domain-containing protein [Alphaproteobacteria bacterium]